MSRTTTLGLVLGLGAVGCGSKPEPPPAPTAELVPDPAPAPRPAPPPAPVVHEMDPAKHAIPDGPVRGRLAGVEVTGADVALEGRTLIFRKPAGAPGEEWRVSVELPADPGRDGSPPRLTLAPTAEVPDGPAWAVFADLPKPVEFEDKGGWRAERRLGWRGGCAVTLEFGKRDAGKLPGKVFLALPDLPNVRPGTPTRNVLAGAFVAACPRQPTDPPGPDDVPFVNGSVAVRGAGPGAALRTGYFGALGPDRFAFAAAGDLELDGRQTARSSYDKPHVTTLVAGDASTPSRYEHSRLTPGRYLVFAALRGGPVAGRWVEVKPGSTTPANLALDADQVGGLEVTPPLEALGKVHLVPADEPGRPPLGELAFDAAALHLGLEADIVARKAVFKNLAPGRYEVRAAKQSRVVEVTAGKVAELDFVKK